MSSNELTASLKLDISDWSKKLKTARADITNFTKSLIGVDPMDMSKLIDTSNIKEKFDQQVKEMRLSFEETKPILTAYDEFKTERIPARLDREFGKQIVNVSELILDFKDVSIEDINKPVAEMEEATKTISSLVDEVNIKMASIPEGIRGTPSPTEAEAKEITHIQTTQGMDVGELTNTMEKLIGSLNSLKGATVMLEMDLKS